MKCSSRFLLNIQSMTDVVTNSSSELFLLNTNKSTSALERIIRDYKDQFETSLGSGEGGKLSVSTIKEWYFREVKEIKEFYDEFEITPQIIDFPVNKEGQVDFSIKDEEVEDWISFREFQEWYGEPTSNIFRHVVESFKYDIPQSHRNITITEDSILIDIDWGFETTIEFLKRELGAVKLN